MNMNYFRLHFIWILCVCWEAMELARNAGVDVDQRTLAAFEAMQAWMNNEAELLDLYPAFEGAMYAKFEVERARINAMPGNWQDIRLLVLAEHAAETVCFAVADLSGTAIDHNFSRDMATFEQRIFRCWLFAQCGFEREYL